MIEIPERRIDDDVNTRYNLASRNSLFDMDWRVLKYGENIFLGELRKLVDMFLDCLDEDERRRRRKTEDADKAGSDLDSEMKRLSLVIDDLDFQNLVIEKNEINTTVHTVAKRPVVEKTKLKSPTFNIKKVKPINLVVNLEPDTEYGGDNITPTNEVERDEEKGSKQQFWNMFKDDSEWWKELAKRNLERMKETRRELERFSGHELVLEDIDEYTREKDTLESFIDDIDSSRTYDRDLEYDKKYEEMVLKLIEFARKDFVYEGFDPLIEKLKHLSNAQIAGRKRQVNLRDILNACTKIDITKYTYEELCALERCYKEIMRRYETDTSGSENVIEIDRDDARSAPPCCNRRVVLNVDSQQSHGDNSKRYTTNSLTRNSILKKSRHGRNDLEILDLSRSFPMEYYANNWWKIYEDVLKSREQQFGSIGNWWNFYEGVLNGHTNEEDLNRIPSTIRRGERRPTSRMEDQLRMLEEVRHSRFRESEGVETGDNESVMVTNVTSLLKTVKAVEDEHTRGTRALESTIEAISQEIEMLYTPPSSPSSVEELVRCARLMTAATARAVGASGQDQLTAAANLGRRTVLDVLSAARGAAQTAETEEIKRRTLETSKAMAEAYRALLGALLAGDRNQLPELSRRVAMAVADMLAAAELLKGSEWVDPADPTVIAEQELLGAAASIDAAARKLDALRPRVQHTAQADENLNFDEMILEAAKSIIAATSALVRAASAAQRELIDQGKVARRPASSSDDGQWSEGLVSAARLVAAAAHALVEAANALVQGAATEERLISSARQVASSTAQLLVACKVKADPSAESTRRLQGAGAEVIRSTDNLVRAARDAITCDDERSLVLNRRMVGGIAQEIDARSEVLRIEKELEEARGRLTAIRQAKYKLRDASGEDTDTEQHGYCSDASGNNRFKTPSSSFNTTYSPNSTYTQNTTQNTTHNTLNTTQNTQSISINQSYTQNGTAQDKSPSFSSFRPDDTPKNYEGFTTRYETRLYDTPRPIDEHYAKTEDRRHHGNDQIYRERRFGRDAGAPPSPGFDARDMRFDEKEPIHSTLGKPTSLDGVGQNFSEHQKSTERIPGGTKHSEYTMKSESYQSHPKTEFFETEMRQEVRSPFATSTPSKFDRPEFPEFPRPTLDVAKAPTPDYDRISSPYGKEVHSYGGPNFFEETTTEVKEVPNGTQKITTTKIYSSSPVNMTTTSTKYEPVKLEGIDELAKAFDNESKYSTLDSRFDTLESKMSSDTSRSFMRPSEFQASEFRATSGLSETKPSELMKEIDNMDRKFSKRTVSSEIIEKKSVMTSSHKSESSSTVTKKFGNF